MAYWQFDLLAVALPALLLVHGLRLPGRLVLATAALAAVALAWTAPWDEHLVRTGVWSYGPDRVLATVGSVPAEEYVLVVLLVCLVAAWGARTGLLRPAAGPVTGSRTTGTLGWLAVAAAGVLLVSVGGELRYLGLLLVWAAPPLALQHAVAGDLLAGRRWARALVALPVAVWLCVADRVALADGIWAVSPGSSTGVRLLGLPLEEAVFFLLTCALVTDGLLLAVDDRALARARRVLPRHRAAPPAHA